MDGKIFIKKLRLQNFLSYNSEGQEIELQPLNVLIGPNGSGKSNLIEALGILKATPTDLPSPIRQGGGINNFIWKGNKEASIANIEAIVNYPKGSQNLRYQISLTANNHRVELVDEAVEDEQSYPGEDDVYFYYRYQKGHPVLNFNGSTNASIKEESRKRRVKKAPLQIGGQKPVKALPKDLPKDLLKALSVREKLLKREDLSPDQSILSQIKDPDLYPELFYLSTEFSRISLYRHWQMGRYSEPRNAQPADLPIHPLQENASNLGLFLNYLLKELGQRKIIEQLKEFYDVAEEIQLDIYGGNVQILIREEGIYQPIPATRLSDGTLRYLFLMALLLDPNPPPLICIEEPEIGLHPDILSTIAEMLIEASQRTQLIITTHSDALVAGLNEYPESVLVCERNQKGSQLRRLEPEKLKSWLENYNLGDLWTMGEIGGNRW